MGLWKLQTHGDLYPVSLGVATGVGPGLFHATFVAWIWPVLFVNPNSTRSSSLSRPAYIAGSELTLDL